VTGLICEEAPYDCVGLRLFVGIDLGREPVPDATTMPKLRRLLHDNKLGESLFAEAGAELQVPFQQSLEPPPCQRLAVFG
jgi:transposase, IS5 family